MKIRLDLQKATKVSPLPDKQKFQTWVETAIANHREQAELTIRIVDKEEASILNETWRKSRGPTNVLSFPLDNADKYVPGLLGDIVICAPLIVEEAKNQGKPVESHWAHMVIHGTLHLLGYDHTGPDDAERMENIEIRLMDGLGYDNPYEPVCGV